MGARHGGTSVPIIDPSEAFGRIGRELNQVKIRALNGLRHLADRPIGQIAVTPRTAVWTRDAVVLYRYARSTRVGRTPVLLVHSLITRPYVFDLRPGSSLVEDLLAAGHDVYLLDWGIPGPVEAGNTLESYCDEYLPQAAEAVLRSAGSDRLSMVGYCLGAVLSLLALAGNTALPVRGLVALATPVDFSRLGPVPKLLAEGRLEPEDMLDETGNVPAPVVRDSFRLVQPTADLTTYASLWHSLANDERAAAHQALIGWSTEHIPFPGAALRQIVHLLIRGPGLAGGPVPLGGRQVALSRIPCPVLSVVGDRDNLVPPEATAPLADALSGARLDTLRLPAGHAGLFVGRQAKRHGVPAILAWLAERD